MQVLVVHMCSYCKLETTPCFVHVDMCCTSLGPLKAPPLLPSYEYDDVDTPPDFTTDKFAEQLGL